MAIPAIPDIRTLVEAGVHFGHASGRWHPKMAPYIFATRDKLHIIDLEKTQEKLKEVLPILEERIRDGKVVMLVGTKKQVSKKIQEIGERTGLPYVNERWLGGTLTNFGEMQNSIRRMKEIESFLASTEATSMIKKERVRLEAELQRMHVKFGGLRDLTRKPDALFIVDTAHEHNAMKEAQHDGIEIFSIVDTNCDPSQSDHFLPANDDGQKSINLLLSLIEHTILNGQKAVSVKKEEAEKKAAEANLEGVSEMSDNKEAKAALA